jgi:hypothetical protein
MHRASPVRVRSAPHSGSRCRRPKCRPPHFAVPQAGSATVIGCAQVRAALEHFAGDAGILLARHAALDRRLHARIARYTAWLCRCVRMACPEEVTRPFPHVAGHVEQPIAVGGKGTHRRGALVPVRRQVLPGELALPRVGQRVAARRVLVAPHVGGAFQSTASGELPFRLRGQCLSRQDAYAAASSWTTCTTG